MWILLVEGEEAGQAAANVAWYFFKGSIGIKRYKWLLFHQNSTPVAVVVFAVFGRPTAAAPVYIWSNAT
ncbi:hypothetical protein JOB18_033705 [Solea senegalensis]|uniref:Uncharacterized protein n=1 Tax=Solea senegalensis TaxID=28829 RepID=A0AAV6SVM8_SOLSE|nr:hypothetical protein JOB18_033705 [Solea senegalensis]